MSEVAKATREKERERERERERESTARAQSAALPQQKRKMGCSQPGEGVTPQRIIFSKGRDAKTKYFASRLDMIHGSPG